MKVAVFSAKAYDRHFLTQANHAYHHDLTFFETRLTPKTSPLAEGFPAVCAFINDQLDSETLHALRQQQTHLIALRSAGFNNVDLEAAQALDMTVVRVPAYSPYAVAEHAVGLILMLNRKLYRAYNRVRDDNFSLDGLLGFDLHGCTVGIIGTGKIGQCFASIMHGFGCNLVAYDPYPASACLELGVTYTDLPELLGQSDMISLHCPLLPDTYHLINRETIQQLKPGVMVINTSRGGLIDTPAIIEGIKSGQVGYFGADVYEEEGPLFFEDRSDTVIQDDTFQLLQSFPNVVLTAHQGFFTRNALDNIAQTTLANIADIEANRPCPNRIAIT
ncbi:D-lactate dehydrogenase [Halomicronema hongdechloris C2206]|uniref:D-lactate dehydrogenase n=1 Tax=Halomicronema hongdechloris C2206 TaxID=1641165 RepID=A0A1Z3HJN7_9CYAN|nr:2-hydroxyacid dehydrogenase [Halomicronema hongdechloris]ASC70510.1 D-lactate dehydrogenase [Halomicronema hongdechloris C2206]